MKGQSVSTSSVQEGAGHSGYLAQSILTGETPRPLTGEERASTRRLELDMACSVCNTPDFRWMQPTEHAYGPEDSFFTCPTCLGTRSGKK